MNGTPSRPLPAPSAAPARGRSLRARAFTGVLLLVLYLLGSVVYVSIERSKIYDSIEQLQLLSRHERALALAEAAVSGARIDVQEAGAAGSEAQAPLQEIALYMETCTRLFAALDEFDPAYALLARQITRSYESLKASPVRAHWIDLRESLDRAASDLEIRRASLVERRESLTTGYQRQYDRVTIESIVLALAGVAIFGSMTAWFFARLTLDIGQLEAHARRIVHGTRGVALPVTRDDEVGRLMLAVNRMAVDLDEREKQLEIESQRRSHHDKMTAVGALAAGVAHEVNNPLAVISAVAEDLAAQRGTVPAERVVDGAQQILGQLQRAALAARQLAEAAAPHPAEHTWVDFNGLLQRVLKLASYDKRYRHVAIEATLDASLPALRTAGDAVQQVLMLMVSLACEAIGPSPAGRAPTLAVATGSRGDAVHARVRVPAVLDLGRDDVRRRVELARAIAAPLHGHLALDQDADGGTTLTLEIVVEPPGNAAGGREAQRS